MNLVNIYIKEIHSEENKQTTEGNKYILADITISDPAGTRREKVSFLPKQWEAAKQGMFYLG